MVGGAEIVSSYGALPKPPEQTPSRTLDALQAQNIALQVQLSGQERELAQCKHALNLALSKAGSWGTIRHRVTLTKSLNHVPVKAWPPTQPSAAGSGEEGADEATAAQTTIAALHAQLENAREDVAEAKAAASRTAAENESLRQELQKRPAVSSATAAGGAGAGGVGKQHSAVVAHLMAQIKFLHNEVERLESVATQAREQGAAEASGAALKYNAVMAKDAQIEKLQRELHRYKTGGQPAAYPQHLPGTMVPQHHHQQHPQAQQQSAAVEELTQRVETLQQEKGTALADKNDLQAKVRKLEGVIKGLKGTVAEVEHQRDTAAKGTTVQGKELHKAITALSRERDELRENLDRFRVKASVPRREQDSQTVDVTLQAASCQTESEEDDSLPHGSDFGCQVDTRTRPTIVGHGDSDEHAMTVPALAHALEIKCGELDAVRAELEQLQAEGRFSAMSAKELRGALEDESARRRAAESESERLQLQVRALQQQSSQLQVHVRDAQRAAQDAESRMTNALQSNLRCEEERRVWEEQIATNAKDIDTLVAQQALANQHVASAAEESDRLRGELQKALHREAQLEYAVKAKGAELGEVMAAYQQCVQSAETLQNSFGTVERECDNLRAIVTTRDERIDGMSEQITHLNEREQQLCIDLQALDYENNLLHRKLAASDNRAMQGEAQAHEAAQALQGTQRVLQEVERAQAECQKHLVLKENELMLLRQRCDEVTQEHMGSSQAQQLASQRIQQLEEANARLSVQGVMTRVAQDESHAMVDEAARQFQADNAALRSANLKLEQRVDEQSRTLDLLRSTLNDEQQTVDVLRSEVADLAQQRDTLSTAQTRLEGLVREQAEQLANVSA